MVKLFLRAAPPGMAGAVLALLAGLLTAPSAHAADAAAPSIDSAAATAGAADAATSTDGRLAPIVVTAQRLNEARLGIETKTGASTYIIDNQAIEAQPGGGNQSLNQVLLQAPDVVQDSFGQLHVRGDHNGLQYRLNGVILPEGISVFSQSLSPRLVSSVSLLTGALPAEYGLRTAGVIDMTSNSATAPKSVSRGRRTSPVICSPNDTTEADQAPSPSSRERRSLSADSSARAWSIDTPGRSLAITWRKRPQLRLSAVDANGIQSGCSVIHP